MRRIIPAIALLAFACTETPTTPEAQFAKGGKNAIEVSLVEYWVVHQDDGSSLIHVVANASGTIDLVFAEVAHDVNITNGVMDWAAHYERSRSLEDPEDPSEGYIIDPRTPWVDESGLIHADLTFNGPWPDEPTTGVPGEPDPFVFLLRFWTDGIQIGGTYPGTYRGPSIRPQGVVVNGEVQGTENVEVRDPDNPSATMLVNSFATYASMDPSTGLPYPSTGSVSVQSLMLSNVTCTKRHRKGQTITLVEGDYSAALSTMDAMMELHLSDGTNLGPRVNSVYGSAAGHITAEFEGYDPANLQVSLWLDYVAANDRFVVYDPGQNDESLETDGNVVKTESQSCGG